MTSTVLAWRPPVRGLREVLHAHLVDHAYPMHVHDAWTLLIVDDGAVRYGLDRHEHGALTSLVTLLPPYVPHDGRSVGSGGFRKRVLYLERELLDDALIGAAVDAPSLTDPVLQLRLRQLHEVLLDRHERLDAQSRLLLIRDRLQEHLLPGRLPADSAARDPGVADQFRALLDAHLQDGICLEDAARTLGRHPSSLLRAFSRAYGMPPHLYLTGRRVDTARRHLLDGVPPGTAATLAGFYDQSHLTRHFRRFLGITPARFARTPPA